MASDLARRRVRLLALAFGGATAFAVRPPTAAAADTYPVKLDRRYRVGVEFTVDAKVDSDLIVRTSVDGRAQPDRHVGFAAELAGTVRVLAVGERTGQPTRVRLTVGRATKDGVELFPAGTVIVADHTGPTATFTIDGVDAWLEEADALNLLVDVERADKPADEDALFGTPDPQPVGGHWGGDLPTMAASLTADGIPVSAAHLTVTSKLVKVAPGDDGKPAETIQTTYAADPLEVGQAVIGLTVTGGTTSGTCTQTMPVDGDRPVTSADIHMAGRLRGTAHVQAGTVTAEITTVCNVHRTATPKP